MDIIVVNKLREELGELKASLAADPRQQRIELIEDFLDDYQRTGKLTGVAPIEPSSKATATMPPPTTKAAKVKHALVSFLKQRGRSATRKEMLDYLVSKNLLGDETKPLKRLAIYLTQANRENILETDGNGNWKLNARFAA